MPTLSETRPTMFKHTSLLKSKRVQGVWIVTSLTLTMLPLWLWVKICLGRERKAGSIYDNTSTEQCGR